ncbi:MAG TPA: efflux RND transporter permease subunit, partial [Polyangiales bacterium]|nr:efflux RND transporter permease subunit [Polyangiales bacterium]
LVDDSIVELENIHRHLALGQNRKQAVLAAAQEVAMPILVSTITTIVVFLPVLFLAGVARYLFIPLAATIAFALTMSFLVSRTVTPLLCYYVLGKNHGAPNAFVRGLTRMLDGLDHAYAGALAFTLRHRALTLLAIAGLFAGSLVLKSQIGSEFFPATDESQFSINYKVPIGTRVERTEDVTARLEALVQKELAPVDTPRGKSPVFTTMISDTGLPIGRTALFTQNTGTHTGNLQVNLVPRVKRSISDVAASEKIRAALGEQFPGSQITFFVGGIVKRILNFGSPAPIDIEVLGYDVDAGSDYAKKLLPKLRAASDKDGAPLLTDVQMSREENAPELDVVVDRQKAGMLGLSEQDVAQSVLTSLHGNTEFAPIPFTDPETGNSYFVNVRLDDEFRSHVTDLRDISMRTPSGSMISLDGVAKVTRGSGPVLVDRKYLQRIIHVTANIAPGKALGTASDAVRKALSEVTAPDGFSVQVGGQTVEQEKAFKGLTMAALMALALVYMVLASQFKSLIDPLVIMFSVPLGVSGVFLALYLTDTTLNVNSFMGIIMMVGIVVSNGVLLVDFANVLRTRGKPLIEATVEAGRTRLRPILMTTIATIFGLLPMAAGIGEGSETNLPLARAVIGGLAVSTVFTLFLVPCLYTLLDRFAKRTPIDQDEDDASTALGGSHA